MLYVGFVDRRLLDSGGYLTQQLRRGERRLLHILLHYKRAYLLILSYHPDEAIVFQRPVAPALFYGTGQTHHQSQHVEIQLIGKPLLLGRRRRLTLKCKQLFCEQIRIQQLDYFDSYQDTINHSNK